MKLVVRTLQEPVQHAELVEDFHGRRMNRVATKIVQEVGVLLEHRHGAARPCEQQSGHHARGTAADNNQIQLRANPSGPFR